MIGRITRAFRGPGHEKASWQFETDHGEEKVDEVRVGRSDLSQEDEQKGVFVPYDTNEIDRQTDLVRTAIAQGGRFGDHEIPIPWLRRMLAGLEGRPIDEDKMWEGIASPPRRDSVEESPTYQEFFPRAR